MTSGLIIAPDATIPCKKIRNDDNINENKYFFLGLQLFGTLTVRIVNYSFIPTRPSID